MSDYGLALTIQLFIASFFVVGALEKINISLGRIEALLREIADQGYYDNTEEEDGE
jgi:hypothetical protein